MTIFINFTFDNNSTIINKMSNHLPLQTSKIYGVGNPGPCLRQVSKCGGIKPVNGILTMLSHLEFEKRELF
jgi:hypothetical protein